MHARAISMYISTNHTNGRGHKAPSLNRSYSSPPPDIYLPRTASLMSKHLRRLERLVKNGCDVVN